MNTDRHRDRLRAVEALLDAERDLILDGELGELEALSRDKERLVSGLSTQPEHRRILTRLRAKAERNANLLGSAREGIRSAIRRLRTLQEGGEDLNTYDRAGKRVSVRNGRRGDIERKA